MNRNHPSLVPSNRRPTDDSIRYRVRDSDWGNVWGTDLTWDQAQKLLSELVAQKKTRIASVRPMGERPPDWWVAENAPQAPALEDLSVPESSPASLPASPSVPNPGTLYKVASAMAPTTIQSDGVVGEIPVAHQLMVNGQDRPVPTRVAKGDVVECRLLHPAAATARASATGAAATVIQAKRRAYYDVTVKKPAPRTAPAPRDRTLSNQPVTVRLGTPQETPPEPLPSPQKVAELEDGDPLPDDAITDADLPDLAVDLGGGASDADVEHARRQAEAERSRG